MKYYERTVTRREKINHFGKLGYVPYIEFFKTNDEKFLADANYRKQVKFSEVKRDKKFLHIESNKIESIKLQGEIK